MRSKANPAMGQSKSSPVTSKFTFGEENDRIKYAASSMQGWRPYMEDAHATILDLDDSKSTSFFGVYDGHGGANVATYCASRFHTELAKDVDYHDNLAIAIQHVYFRIDEQLQELDEWRALANPPRVNISMISCLKSAVCADVWFPGKGTPYNEGSTACVALIRGNQIIVGNVGDSRCVLSRNGQAIELSTDHKPNLPDERKRILNAGGRIIRDALPRKLLGRIVGIQWGAYRVNGQLAMSRAIGDFEFKKNRNLLPAEQMVTCNPEICTVDITDDTEFLLIASDGIWDAVSSQHVVNFVHHYLTSGETDLRAICERLLDHCMRAKDNMTVILVQFKPSAVPVVEPTNIAGSSNNPDPTASASSKPSAVAEAKTDTDTDIDTEITEVKEEQPSSRSTKVDEKEPCVDDEDGPLLPTSSSTEES